MRRTTFAAVAAVAAVVAWTGITGGTAQPAAAAEAAVPVCQTFLLHDPGGPDFRPRGGAALCDPSAPGTRVRVVVDCTAPVWAPPDVRVFGPWVAQDGRTRSIAWCPASHVAVDVSYELV